MKIYVVMSTHENESEYHVKSAFRTEKSADKAVATLYEEYAEYGFTGEDEEIYNPWQVWIEEVELQEEPVKEYTNYETKKVIEEILESSDLFTDAQTHRDNHGDFTEESVKELFEHHSCLYRSIENVNWKEVADELNQA